MLIFNNIYYILLGKVLSDKSDKSNKSEESDRSDIIIKKQQEKMRWRLLLYVIC